MRPADPLEQNSFQFFTSSASLDWSKCPFQQRSTLERSNGVSGGVQLKCIWAISPVEISESARCVEAACSVICSWLAREGAASAPPSTTAPSRPKTPSRMGVRIEQLIKTTKRCFQRRR
jgi:hypothetical protein